MKRIAIILSAAILAAPLALIAQSGPSSDSSVAAGPVAVEAGSDGAVTPARYKGPDDSETPLSRIGFGAGISPLGIQLQTAVNLSSHFNLRADGNFFNYATSFASNGINASGQLNLSSAGASLDVYPFRSGFHISPGLLFRNQDQISATANVPAGSSFTLNGTTYYSANANAATGATPITGTGILGLNTNNPAFTATAGWGNIARHNGHWSVPFEAGVAFIGDPSVKVNLGGWACADQAQTECSDLSSTTNPIAVAIQSNLTAQIAKWTTDLSPLKTFPIASVGLAYSFHVR
jgi:hypothetical protein